jgi:class 3 adenylate cyclase
MDTGGKRKVERRLVTIFAADFVSYSAHMGNDEEATARILKAHRSVIDGIIAFHDGRIFDTAGDSVLAEFGSPVQAVRAALEVQEALQTRNESLDPASRMVLRIGINLGDVLVEGDNLVGDAINIAARLESMAKPGGIIVSGAVHDQVQGKIDWGFSDLGTPPLKNIARPIRVLEVTRTPARAAPAAPQKKAGVPRIAVLAVLAITLIATAAGAAVWWSVRTAPAPIAAKAPVVAPPPLASAPAAVAPAAVNVPAGAGPASGYLTEEPPMGKLGQGVRVLVDDRTCPDGEIKEVVGGNFYWPDGTKKKEGAVRTRRCIPR